MSSGVGCTLVASQWHDPVTAVAAAANFANTDQIAVFVGFASGRLLLVPVPHTADTGEQVVL